MRGETPGLDEELHAARTRILVAEAQLRTLDYLERLGVTHRIDDILPGWQEAVINFRANLDNIPRRVAQLVAYETDDDKVSALMQREVEAALRPIDDYMARMKELAAQSRKLRDSLASDPLFARLSQPDGRE